MANLRALPLLAAAVLMLAPAATATPLAPIAHINGYAVAAPTGPIALGTSMNMTVTLTGVTVDNMVCSAAVDSSVALTLGGVGPAGVTGAPPTSIPITFAQSGTSTTATATVKTGTPPIQFVVSVARTAAPNHDHTFFLNATYTGTPSGCQDSVAAGDPQPSALASATVAIKTGPALGNATTTTGPCAAPPCPTTPANTSSTKASPLADVPTVALLMLGVALVASRKQQK